MIERRRCCRLTQTEPWGKAKYFTPPSSGPRWRSSIPHFSSAGRSPICPKIPHITFTSIPIRPLSHLENYAYTGSSSSAISDSLDATPGSAGGRGFRGTLIFDHLPPHHAGQEHPKKAVDLNVQPAIAKEIDDEDTCHQQSKTQADGLQKRVPGAAKSFRPTRVIFARIKRKNSRPITPVSTSTFRK